jgi:hypothetical protein
MFPRLFPDAGWWCPSLNPAMGGSRLWDFSIRQSWGVMNGFTGASWQTSFGKSALNFTGSEYVDSISNSPYRNGWAVSIWFKSSSAASNMRVALGIGNSASVPDFGLLPNRNGTVQVYLPDIYRDSGVASSTNWTHVVMIRGQSTSGTLVVNGRVFSANATTSAGAAINIRIGNWGNTTASSSGYQGLVDDVRLFGPWFGVQDAIDIYRIGRGNMPLRRRRRYTEQAGGFKGYWANRQHLIGSGVY